MIEEIKNCRVCGSENLDEVYSLGELYPSNFVENQEGYEKAPLTLVQCRDCYLMQLKHTVTPDDMYKSHYWYQSSLNKSMVKDLQNIVDSIQQRIKLDPFFDMVVDIGCNDGTLLSLYPKEIFKIGYDPVPNLKEQAEKNCDVFINDYFSYHKFPMYYNFDEPYDDSIRHKAKVVTAIAMFYDLPKPVEFVKDVVKILDKDGIFVLQLTDLYSMLKINAFDNICHEHLEYYTLQSICNVLFRGGLEVFDVEYNKVNGGSIRVYACFSGSYPVSENVKACLLDEYRNLEGLWKSFDRKVVGIAVVTRALINTLKVENKTIYGMGASTKGNTFLQYFDLNTKHIPLITEVNEDKKGLRTIGTDIPIVLEKDLEKEPDYYLLLPFHFIDDILNKKLEYLKSGGKIYVAMPIPSIYYYKDGSIYKQYLVY